MPRRRKLLAKVVMIGDSQTGKTSVMNMFVNGRFSQRYKATIGADFMTKLVGDVTLQLWDTAGQERFQSLGVAFYRGADAVILMYDVGNRQSLRNLDGHLKQFLESARPSDATKFPAFVVGNKTDLKEGATPLVTDSDLKAFSAAHGSKLQMHFATVSAKTGDGVEKLFYDIANAMHRKDNPADNVAFLPLASRAAASAVAAPAPAAAGLSRNPSLFSGGGTPYFPTVDDEAVQSAAAEAAARPARFSGAGAPSKGGKEDEEEGKAEPTLKWCISSSEADASRDRSGLNLSLQGLTREAASAAITEMGGDNEVTLAMTLSILVKEDVDMFALGEIVGIIKTAHDAYLDSRDGRHLVQGTRYTGVMKVKPATRNDGRTLLKFTFHFKMPTIMHEKDAEVFSKLKGSISLVLHTTLAGMLEADSVTKSFPEGGSLTVQLDKVFANVGDKHLWEARLRRSVETSRHGPDVAALGLLLLDVFSVEAPGADLAMLRNLIPEEFNGVSWKQLWLEMLGGVHCSHKVAANLLVQLRSLEAIEELEVVCSSVPLSATLSCEGLDIFAMIPDAAAYEHAPRAPPPNRRHNGRAYAMPAPKAGTSTAELDIGLTPRVPVANPSRMAAHLSLRNVTVAEAKAALAAQHRAGTEVSSLADASHYGLMLEASAHPSVRARLSEVSKAVASAEAEMRPELARGMPGRLYQRDLCVRSVDTPAGPMLRCNMTATRSGPVPGIFDWLQAGTGGSLNVDVELQESFKKCVTTTSPSDWIPSSGTATARLAIPREGWGKLTETSHPTEPAAIKAAMWGLRILTALNIKLRLNYTDAALPILKAILRRSQMPMSIADGTQRSIASMPDHLPLKAAAIKCGEVLQALTAIEVVMVSPPAILRLDLEGIDLFSEVVASPAVRSGRTSVAPPPVPEAGAGSGSSSQAKKVLLLGETGVDLLTALGCEASTFREAVQVEYAGTSLSFQAHCPTDGLHAAVAVVDVADPGSFGALISQLSVLPATLPTVVLASSIMPPPDGELTRLTDLFSLSDNGKITNRRVYLCCIPNGTGYQTALDDLVASL